MFVIPSRSREKSHLLILISSLCYFHSYCHVVYPLEARNIFSQCIGNIRVKGLAFDAIISDLSFFEIFIEFLLFRCAVILELKGAETRIEEIQSDSNNKSVNHERNLANSNRWNDFTSSKPDGCYLTKSIRSWTRIIPSFPTLDRPINRSRENSRRKVSWHFLS